MAKPLSLADRIIQSKKENENEKELSKEKRLICSLAKQDGSKGFPTPSQRVSKGFPTPFQPLSKKIILSKRQFVVYNFLIQNQYQGIFNKPFIEKVTGVSYGTISDIIRKFKKLNILIINYNKHAKVYHYKINTKIDINQPNFSHELEAKPLAISSQRYSNGFPIPSLYSSSNYNKTTTTLKKINLQINENLELGYWKQKKITAKQITQWMKLADCNLDTIVQYLCYCRFEMLDLDFENSKPIKNVFNWFFRILEKTGGYPKPKGYKSFHEKTIEMKLKIIQEKEAQKFREILGNGE